jgi:glycosyltransferase involved in cell wall biosynthesis
MKRIAWWSPLPPQGSGIADYSARLLEELREDYSITAVVAPGVGDGVIAPEGVEVADIDDYRAEEFALDVYHFGNHAGFHAYMHTPVIERPGLMVLHDPSLVDFYVNLCGGTRSPIYHEEIRFNSPENTPDWMTKKDQTWADLDRLELLLSKRVIDASLVTVVHSPWAKRRLGVRSPSARIEHSWLGADLMERPLTSSEIVTFAVLGGVTRHKRVLEVLDAFREVARDEVPARLVIAGRVDDEAYFSELQTFITANRLSEQVQILPRLEDKEFDDALLSCDVLISLRWPTAGETSSVMMRAFGAGKVVIASDVPQNRDFGSDFCRLVSIDLEIEKSDLVGAIRAFGADVATVRAAGAEARRFVEAEASFGVVAARYRALIDELSEGRVRAREIGEQTEQGRDPIEFGYRGVNAIGNWAAATGLAEAARRAVEAIIATGTPVAVEDFATGVPEDPGRLSSIISARPTGRAFSTDLYFLNINELQLVTDAYMRDGESNRYKIGFWYWELPTVPLNFAHQLRRLDEVWVASEYVRQSFQGEVGVPIQVMPCIVEPRDAPEMHRSEFGLGEDRCIFLFHFDANSTFARKNPLGVIEAFHRAFPLRSDAGPLLVMKTQNLAKLPRARALLTEHMKSVGGVLIDGELSNEEMSALLVACDVYVSLHRAEGFGLGMAEAMYYSKPVIATAFSGNMEFCTLRNSALVDYSVAQVDPIELTLNPGAELVYEPGALWAEPDIDQAARWMRHLYAEPELRRRLGSSGAETIRTRFNSEAAGRRMADRIRELGSSALRGRSSAPHHR